MSAQAPVLSFQEAASSALPVTVPETARQTPSEAPVIRSAARVFSYQSATFFVAGAAALAVHFWWPTESFVAPKPAYKWALEIALAAWLLLTILGIFLERIRGFTKHYGPLFAAGAALIAVWEIVTAKSGLLPMPYFPGPDRVFGAISEDAPLLLKSAGHSLRLLFTGYLAGCLSGFLFGLAHGWSRTVRYWGTPVLKTLGPIPAIAWIPLAMMLLPTTFGASVFLIALASAFPMTVLTSSGISSVRQSHLEVARTLGATPFQLISQVAIPSALPTIFIGLFKGLSASFLTLVVAEMIGVKAGLGWYITWAQNYLEYNKVYAALIIMAIFFSTIMSSLFFVRDRILRWQEGVIKW